jgi:predicted metal-dependent HD superfamily phosphohydrolase
MREQWDNAVAQLGGLPTAAADDLERRYAEPHRKYHNAFHVNAVLRDAARLSEEENPVLVLAICAHDVIYDAQPGDDERASAAWARDRLAEAEVGRAHIAHVESLVLATITHQSDDPLAHILLDADLAILAAEQPVYDLYTRCVRVEYGKYPDEAWRQGRAQVLERLLDRDDLYRTSRARALWDTRARINLTRELRSLSLL